MKKYKKYCSKMFLSIDWFTFSDLLEWLKRIALHSVQCTALSPNKTAFGWRWEMSEAKIAVFGCSVIVHLSNSLVPLILIITLGLQFLITSPFSHCPRICLGAIHFSTFKYKFQKQNHTSFAFSNPTQTSHSSLNHVIG